MLLKSLLIASVVACAAVLSACTTTTEKWTITETDGKVTVYERTTTQLLIDADMEVTYDMLGRKVWRFKIRSGPHKDDSYDFPSKQDAMDKLPGILRNGVWANGDKVTEEDITEAVDFVEKYWVDPSSNS